jgi:creatinine amidohydrolase
LLHLAPQLVTKAAAKPRPASAPAPGLFPDGPIAWGWKLDDLAPHEAQQSGWIGRPDLATAELGRMMVDHAAQELLRVLRGMAAAWPPQ